MRELTIIIRRHKLPDTKKALEELGLPSMSIQSVDGRGKQKGVLNFEYDDEMKDGLSSAVRLVPTPSVYALEHQLQKPVLYVPKRMLTVVVPETMVESAVNAVINANQTGRHGDGKIFVSPVELSVRVRTGERGVAAI
ncbi:MAG: P-II family nitrogen regulator [Nitrospirae bacterium]|nr:P-II family nitrogen regulator [Nitrospirota bacterium]MBF0536582.1 P-II family nitrogen regulator [Nitrospirota bacterium]MBF0618296.1 P-II family nitrogen regulator [Nitrospirota bacterium]